MFGNNFKCRALGNFAGPTKYFSQGLQKFHAFSVFVFFSSFSCLVHLKTVSQHKSSPFAVINRTHVIFLMMYSESLYTTQNISFLVPNRAHIHVHIEQCRFVFGTT